MLLKYITRLFDTFALGATFFLLAIVAINIVTRQIHSLSAGDINLMIPGAIELSKYTLLLIVFAALPHAASTSMVRVDLLINRFPKSINNFLNALWLILMACFTAILSWLFIDKAILTFGRGDVSQDLQMPLYYFYALISLACIATTLSCLLKVFESKTQNQTKAIL